MLYNQLIQSYELLTLLLSFNNDIFISDRDALQRLAKKLDNQFSGNQFIGIFESISDISQNGEIVGEDLFIDFHKINLKHTNLDVLSKKDRFTNYLCISCWLRQLKINFEDIGLLTKILSIDKSFTQIVDVFFNNKAIDPITVGKNELIILKPSVEEKDNLEGTWVESNVSKELADEGYFMFKDLNKPYKVLFIGDLKIFVITGVESNASISRDSEKSICGWEPIESGDVIYIEDHIKIDFYELKHRYLKKKFGQKLFIGVQDLSFNYSPGKGISRFNLDIEGGTLLGVMGKEGTGKSTILKLLAGEIPFTHGEVRINGYSLKKELYHLKGMIGYVPEEDLLYDELTVKENLYYAARLFLSKLDETALSQKVNKLLKDLNLTGIKDRVVGRVKDKKLQPGQRRLLNIAMELIREPQILVVDNAISPLSIVDCAQVIEVLANYTFQGHIVITSITQTDNRTIQLFDNVFILDEAGFPIFYGKLGDAWDTFLTLFRSENKDLIRREPASIIQFISQPYYTDYESLSERYKSPDELYSIYLKRESRKGSQSFQRKVLPENILSTPSLDRQYMIFNLRNFKTKIARTRELLYTVLLSPVLALVFSFIMRGGNAKTYNFSENPYIPEFFFLSILLSIFMGLVSSANEIYREKNIIHKETYLNISFFSYINSKVTYLIIIILIQSFFFVLISNLILRIRGILLLYWLIFFSCQSFGMLLGLILSGSTRVIENLYLRWIPLVFLFQILLGGGLVRFDTFPGNKKNTPIVADLSVARWAYEALMIYQYRENKYGKPVYKFNRNISVGQIYSYHLIPVLRDRTNYCIHNPSAIQDSIDLYCKSIKNALIQIADRYDVFPYENIDKLVPENFNEALADDLSEYLEYIELYFYSLYKQGMIGKENFLLTMSDSLGENYLSNLKSTYLNYDIEREVTGKVSDRKIKIVGATIFIVGDPVFQYPLSDFGRAHFFAPEKKLNGQLIDTVEFNISVIWLMNLFLYILLVFDVFNLTGTRIKSVQK